MQRRARRLNQDAHNSGSRAIRQSPAHQCAHSQRGNVAAPVRCHGRQPGHQDPHTPQVREPTQRIRGDEPTMVTQRIVTQACQLAIGNQLIENSLGADEFPTVAASFQGTPISHATGANIAPKIRSSVIGAPCTSGSRLKSESVRLTRATNTSSTATTFQNNSNPCFVPWLNASNAPCTTRGTLIFPGVAAASSGTRIRAIAIAAGSEKSTPPTSAMQRQG